jgi:2-oxoglutarate dehydrogenase E2 component (dihydrolipoamide succinyltransferase)
MILEMKVPSPGESIKEVEIATWLVKDGDYVEKDQAIAEVDSDKATLELPAEASGIITRGCCWSCCLFNRYCCCKTKR